jgi:hypothetical protein
MVPFPMSEILQPKQRRKIGFRPMRKTGPNQRTNQGDKAQTRPARVLTEYPRKIKIQNAVHGRSDAGITGRHSDRKHSICHTPTERARSRRPEDRRRGPRNSRRNIAELPGSWAGARSHTFERYWACRRPMGSGRASGVASHLTKGPDS